MTLRSAVILGTGLIGTSIALALREHGDVRVWLSDRDPASARLAASMGAGELLPSGPSGAGWLADGSPGDGWLADVAILAVPPLAVAPVLADAQRRRLARVCTDVASVKQLPVQQAAALGCDLAGFVPGHPMAGRERHGPAAARADLFLGRTWAVCPSRETAPWAVALVSELIKACGADEVRTDPASHDRWVALVSHAPHVVAAAMAARLEPAAPEALAIAGQGLRDTTRVAAGDPGLWLQILAANAGPVADVLAAVAADLARVSDALSVPPGTATAPGTDPVLDDISEISGKVILDVLAAGRVGVARIPGKHGQAPRPVSVVQVVIRDEPGELARLFAAAGQAGVNIEDIRIEHSPGLPVGVAELHVRPADAAPLVTAMEKGGWPARG